MGPRRRWNRTVRPTRWYLWLLGCGLALAALAWLWPETAAPPADGPERAAAGDRADVDPSVEWHQGEVPSPSEPAAGARAERSAVARPDLPSAWREALTGYRGRVVTGQGQAVAGATVRLFRIAPDVALPSGLVPGRHQPGGGLEAGRATTAEDGTFLLTGVMPRGLCFLRVGFPDPAAVPLALRAGEGTTRAVQATPRPGEVVDLGDVVLRQGRIVTGRVVDEEGHGIPGATVRVAFLPPLPFAVAPIERLGPDSRIVVAAPGQPAAVLALPELIAEALTVLPIASASTAPDGTFAVPGVDPESNVLAVTAPGRTSRLRQPLRLGDGAVTSVGEILLAAGEVADVLVTDPDGQPVAQAEVVVAPASVGVPVHLGESAGQTDADGRVRHPGLPRGGAIAAARRAADEPWTVGAVAPVDVELRVVLPAAHALTLTVLAADGRPAEAPEVRLLRGALEFAAVEVATFGFGEPVPLRGRLRRLEDGRLRLERLPPGSYVLLVDTATATAPAQEIDLRGDLELTVQLQAFHLLRVRVLDGAGAPLPDAAVYAQARGGSRAARRSQAPWRAGDTDAAGVLIVRTSGQGELRLTARHPAWGEVHGECSAAAAETVLAFGSTGGIDGVLTDGGRPPAPGRWMVVLERRRGEGPRGAIPELPQLQLPDLLGAFQFGALQPGSYRVTVQDSADAVGSMGSLWSYLGRRNRILPWSRKDVELRAGETLTVRLEALVERKEFAGPGAPVHGIALIDGAPADGAVVSARHDGLDFTGVSRVDRLGRFDLGRVPAGKVRIVLSPREVVESRLRDTLFNHLWSQEVTVVDGAARELAIDVASGAVSGFVRDTTGLPVTDGWVHLSRQGGEGAFHRVGLGADGGFRVARLTEGRYSVVAAVDGRRQLLPLTVMVAAGLESGPIELVVQVVAQVRGHIDLAALTAPQPPLLLHLEAEGGGDGAGGRGRVDPRNGRFTVGNVVPGRYRLRLQRGAAFHAVTPSVVEVPAAGLTDLALAVAP